MAPRRHALQTVKMDQLAARENVYPAFPGSVFTTAQFSFCNTMSLLRHNTYDEFGSVRALTILGRFEGDTGGWLMYWREEDGDRLVIRCPPGTTVLIPASVVRYCFTAIKTGETRFVFEQFFNAALGRWVEQGFRSDVDYADEVSAQEFAAHQERRHNRVESTMRLMSKVDEMFV